MVYMGKGAYLDFTSSSKLSWPNIMEDFIQEDIRYYLGIKNKEKCLREYW